MIRLGVTSIGLLATGIDDWAHAQSIFTKQTDYLPDAGINFKTLDILPANERRRTTKLIKLALLSAQDASAGHNFDKNTVATVFSSSDGDMEMVDKIVSSLCLQGSPVSPTHFHNSVHNAPSGYWSIANKLHTPSTSLSAFDDSFSVGLLEAATQIISTEHDILFVAYDMPPPDTLKPFRPVYSAFSTALHLTHAETTGLVASLEIEIIDDNLHITQLQDANLEKLRKDNPAARALPLLECLAKKSSADIFLPYLSDGSLHIRVTPC